MPRDILAKRRLLKEGHATFSACIDSQESVSTSFRKQGFTDEEPGSSECSSDSGRESAAPSEALLSPSVSFELRPLVLSFRTSTVSSSSSSDSLQTNSESRAAHSPVSPYPVGHISLLPRILENLAVSGNQAETKVIQQSLLQKETTSPQQLSSSPLDININNAVGILSIQHHQQLNDPALACPSAVHLPDSPLPALAFLSPASRKRTNSTGEAPANFGPLNLQSNPKQRKTKNGRRPTLDDDLTSPVSGTIIKQEKETSPADSDVIIIRRGDLDKSTNVVEVTEEAKQELEKIDNRIGQYTCKLCKITYPDAFALAGHNCSRIIHIEYQCPECGKAFHCPANLASHRRWHKPKAKSAPVTPKTPKKQSVGLTLSRTFPSSSDEKIPDSTAGTVDNPQACSPTLPPSHMPFKKRFMFGKSFGSKNGQQQQSGVTASKTAESAAIVTKNPTPTLHVPAVPPSLDTEKFYCQVCHNVIYGAPNFARHWHNCFITANRNWTSLFFPMSKRY